MKNINKQKILDVAINEAAQAWARVYNVNKLLMARLEEALKPDSDYSEIWPKTSLLDVEQLKVALANAMTSMQYIIPALSDCSGLVLSGEEEVFIRKMYPDYPKSLQILLAHDLALRNEQIGQEYVKMSLPDFVDVFTSEDME